MILLDVYVVFHNHEIDYWSRVTSRLTKTDINHCGIMVSAGDSDPIYYLTSANRSLRVVDAETCFRKQEPQSIFFMGTVTKQSGKILDLEKEYYIKPKLLVFWYCLGRFLFPFWKPNSCVHFVCKFLQSVGINVSMFPTPLRLYKELENASKIRQL